MVFAQRPIVVMYCWTGLQKVGLCTFQDFLRAGRKKARKILQPYEEYFKPFKRLPQS